MVKEVQLPGDSGLYTIIVPSIFPTGDTRCYLGESDKGWTVVDAGVSTDQARQIWTEEIKRIGIGFKQIRQIFLTHNHPDHNGLAGWLQQQADAEVFISPQDIAMYNKYNLPEKEQIEVLERDMKPFGIPHELIVSFAKDIEIIKQFFQPEADVLPLARGQLFQMGDDRYDHIPIPGHTDGHVMYIGTGKRRIMSGDSLLYDRVSQISDWPYSLLENPLAVQLGALQEVALRNPSMVLTAHGPLFQGVAPRIQQIQHHHQRRLNKVLNLLEREYTLPELCQTINVRARVLQEMRVSWADTLAYLEYLWKQQKISKRQDQYIMYGPVQADPVA